MSDQTTPTYQLDVPPEPPETAVGVDDAGTAWQRHGNRWYPATQRSALLFGPPQGWPWSELLLRKGPIRILCYGTVAQEHIAAGVDGSKSGISAARADVRNVAILLGEHYRDGIDGRGNDQCACGWASGDDGDLWPDHVAEVLASAGVLAAAPVAGSVVIDMVAPPVSPELAEHFRRAILNRRVDHPIVRAEDVGAVAGERARFLGLTEHGHPVGSPTIPDGVEKPRLVAKCGGPAICDDCGADAARLKGEADRG